MEQLAGVLDKLASQLGTTSQYLWGVLIKQAPISATIQLFYTIVIFGLSAGFVKLHFYLCKPLPEENRYDCRYYCRYDKYSEGAIVPMFICGVVLLIITTITFFSIGDIVYGYFNPEYWALDKILSHIKK